jgi:cytidylate kinase
MGETMIGVITITHVCGSGGTEVARLVAHKLGWDLLDRSLVESIARVADLHMGVERFDEQAARWCDVLRSRGVNLDGLCPPVAPRWFGEIDDEAIHPLATQLIRAAADLSECVIVVPGAQCLLQGRADVFNVLAYAPVEERVQALQAHWPEHSDVQALLTRMDSQRAEYIRQHYGRDWLDPMLYDLCVSTSIGLDRATTLINEAVVFPVTNWTATADEEVSLCHSPDQL